MENITSYFSDLGMRAGELANRLRAQGFDLNWKSRLDAVTSVDIELQEYLNEDLSVAFSGVPILGEEKSSGPSDVSCDYFFLVDPIDGTSSFCQPNNDRWGITVALVDKEKPIAGLVVLPSINVVLYAQEGLGAFINGQKLLLPQTKRKMSEAQCTVEIGPWLENHNWYFGFLRELSSRCMGVTAFCSCVWGTYEVLLGRSAAYFNIVEVYPWDIAASVVLIAEAGGQSIPFDSSKTGVDWKNGFTNHVLTGSLGISEEVKELLNHFSQNGV